MSALVALESEFTIDSLPEEALCMVFDLLDLENVKRASLTCRKWRDIIFFSAYISRFKFKIRLPTIAPVRIQPTQSNPTLSYQVECNKFMENVIDSVKHTERCYRNLDLTITYLTVSNFLPLWESIFPKGVENIHSLMLTVEIPSLIFLVPVITHAIQSMSNLRSLSLMHCGLSGQESVLRNSSVKYLQIFVTGMPDFNTARCITLDMPELVSFKGPLSALSPPVDVAQPLVFDKLKYVTLKADFFKLIDRPSIVCRLANIESINLDFCIDDKLFIAICDTCKSLKTLYLNQFTHFDDPVTSRNVSKLVNLRRLKIYGIDKAPDKPLNLSALTRLGHLNLVYLELDKVSLIHLPRSITGLSVYMGVEHEEYARHNITASLKQLQMLYIQYFYRNTEDANHTLVSFHHLKQLELLAFKYAKFSESSFLGMEVPLHQVRELVLVECLLGDNGHQRLQETFPNVKQITFTSVFNFDFQL